MKSKGNKKNAVLDLFVNFALEIIEYTQALKSQSHYEIASQLIRSGTSIGANIWEAQSCESRKDFGHKLKIADKEAINPEIELSYHQIITLSNQ